VNVCSAQLQYEGMPILGDWLYRLEQSSNSSSSMSLPPSVWCPHTDTFGLCCVQLSFPYNTDLAPRTLKQHLLQLNLRHVKSQRWIHIHLPPPPDLRDVFSTTN
jgi:23S rRNA-/tRNA-specific pseudouridylate synthase